MPAARPQHRCLLAACTLALCGLCVTARAQRAAATASSSTPAAEAPDPTRLDVERLPPEALEVTRDMFSSGLFVHGHLGGRGFVGGVGRLSNPGPLARVGLGLELLPWLMLGAGVELSLHETSAPPPPSPGTFQVVDLVGELRLQWPFSARAALWLAGEAGLDFLPGNLLSAYGLPDADSAGLMYGGTLGFDWHLLSRHHSIGLLAGARLYPNLQGIDGEQALGVHSAAYLKYVF